MVLSGFDFLLPCRRHMGAEGSEAAGSEPCHLEKRHARPHPPDADLHWSLGSVIKWIAGRTREAVDRLSIDEDAAKDAVTNLQAALETGEASATASTVVGDSIPRPLPPDTWGRYQVCLEDDGSLLWPRVIHDATEREDLLNVQLSRADVIRNWPPADASEAVPPSTSGKEAACRAWLPR